MCVCVFVSDGQDRNRAGFERTVHFTVGGIWVSMHAWIWDGPRDIKNIILVPPKLVFSFCIVTVKLVSGL